MTATIKASVPEALLWELARLRVQLSALPINSVTDPLLSAIISVLNGQEPGSTYNLEVVERLVHTAKAWLGQDEKVPRVFTAGDFFGCARSEGGDLFLRFPAEALYGLEAQPAKVLAALMQAVRSCRIKNGELAESE